MRSTAVWIASTWSMARHSPDHTASRGDLVSPENGGPRPYWLSGRPLRDALAAVKAAHESSGPTGGMIRSLPDGLAAIDAAAAAARETRR